MMPKYQMEALHITKGIPGLPHVTSYRPKFNRNSKFCTGGYTAYIEGWGLVSSKELGLYSDLYSDFGRLAMELWRSCRLVVDTGIHSNSGKRELHTDKHSSDRQDCVKMVERHIVSVIYRSTS